MNIGEIHYHKENKTKGGKQIEFSAESNQLEKKIKSGNSLQVHLGTYSYVLMLAETEENQNSLLIGRFYTTDELAM